MDITSKNDYFVLVYKILGYLYECLKEGKEPKPEQVTAKSLRVPESYFEYIMKSLFDMDYIEGNENDFSLPSMNGSFCFDLPLDTKAPNDNCDYYETCINETTYITSAGISFLFESLIAEKVSKFLEEGEVNDKAAC